MRNEELRATHSHLIIKIFTSFKMTLLFCHLEEQSDERTFYKEFETLISFYR